LPSFSEQKGKKKEQERRSNSPLSRKPSPSLLMFKRRNEKKTQNQVLTFLSLEAFLLALQCSFSTLPILLECSVGGKEKGQNNSQELSLSLSLLILLSVLNALF
jgi:hypothetical protein